MTGSKFQKNLSSNVKDEIQVRRLTGATSMLSTDINLSRQNAGPRWLSRFSDTLRAGRSGDRIQVGGARFSTPVQTGPGANPASYTMGTGSFPGVKRPGRGGDHPPPSSAKVKEKIEIYIYSPSGPSWPFLG